MTRVEIELRNDGIKEDKLEAAGKMVRKGFKLEDIIEITGLTREDIQKLYELDKDKH